MQKPTSYVLDSDGYVKFSFLEPRNLSKNKVDGTVHRIHVRELIKHIDYDTYVKEGIIPSIDVMPIGCLDDNIEKYKTAPPAWVRSGKLFSDYGYFVDVLVRKMLTQINYDKCVCHERDFDKNVPWKKDIFSFAKQILPTVDTKNITSNFGTYTNLYKWLESRFSDIGKDLLHLAPEYNLENITSHPDIVSGTRVLDIKTTCNYKKMEKETFLQLISYAAILRKLGRNIDEIATVLPLQRTLFYYDLSDWKSDVFLERLQKLAFDLHSKTGKLNTSFQLGANGVNLFGLQVNNIEDVVELLMNMSRFPNEVNGTQIVSSTYPKVGTHVLKQKGSIYETLSMFYEKQNVCPDIPMQMFLRSNRNGNASKFDNDDIARSRQLVDEKELRVFVHTPYFVNLCSMTTKFSHTEKDPTSWCRNIVAQDLEIGDKIGAKGVVIHVGKNKKGNGVSVEQAKDAMRKHILELLKYASETCPLLLETCACQTSELCPHIDELIEFYTSFSKKERRRFGICVDTCHVYAAGYEPDEYLEKWKAKVGLDSIKLVHFNNSSLPKDSHKDRHAPLECGHISASRLKKVYDLCVSNNIPMVYE